MECILKWYLNWKALKYAFHITHCVDEHDHKLSIQGAKYKHLVHCNKFSHTSLLVGSAINKENHTGDQGIELLHTDI